MSPDLVWESTTLRVVRIRPSGCTTYYVVESSVRKDALGNPVWEPATVSTDTQDDLAVAVASLTNELYWAKNALGCSERALAELRARLEVASPEVAQ